jgi:hypothetical protein
MKKIDSADTTYNLLNEYSVAFTTMSLNSSIFTLKEKQYIKENLMGVTDILINESWFSDAKNWIADKATSAWDAIEDKSSAVIDSITNKINTIKKNISEMCESIAAFLRNLFKSFKENIKKMVTKTTTWIRTKYNEFKQKVKDITKDHDENDLRSEFHHAKDVLAHVFTPSSWTAKIVSSQNTENAAKEELKNESASYKGVDILECLYNIDFTLYEDSRSKGNTFLKYFMGMHLEKGKSIGQQSAGWWFKFAGRTVGLILSPIIKLIEAAIKYVSEKGLWGMSILSEALDGPKANKFLIIGGIVGGIIALIIEGPNIFTHFEWKEHLENLPDLGHLIDNAAHFITGPLSAFLESAIPIKHIINILTIIVCANVAWTCIEELVHFKEIVKYDKEETDRLKSKEKRKKEFDIALGKNSSHKKEIENRIHNRGDRSEYSRSNYTPPTKKRN